MAKNKFDTLDDLTATGVAAVNTNRNFILTEKEPECVEIIKQRLNDNEKERDDE